jgi:hypothetical protein
LVVRAGKRLQPLAGPLFRCFPIGSAYACENVADSAVGQARGLKKHDRVAGGTHCMTPAFAVVFRHFARLFRKLQRRFNHDETILYFQTLSRHWKPKENRDFG